MSRCPVCRARLTLTDMKCRCGGVHCLKHRMPEDHACTFNFRAHEQAQLEKSLVACKGDKLRVAQEEVERL